MSNFSSNIHLFYLYYVCGYYICGCKEMTLHGLTFAPPAADKVLIFRSNNNYFSAKSSILTSGLQIFLPIMLCCSAHKFCA